MVVSLIVLTCCLIMGFVDSILQPAYHIKSIIKIILFITLPTIYTYKTKTYSNIFKLKLKSFVISLALAFAVFAVILIAYSLAINVFNFSNITTSLTDNVGVDTGNFVFVTTYIAFINSLLEEFFFRGFAFFQLKKLISRKYAYLFSSFMFSLYHIAIMVGWFDIWVFAITLLGLFVGGIIFCFVNEENENIYSSWLIHMFANFAINLIGFRLFGII